MLELETSQTLQEIERNEVCGIVGWFNPSQRSERFFNALNGTSLVKKLIHRGPSSQDSREFNSDNRTYAMLGAARLAIVGVDNGAQPIQSPCGRWWVSMNGEVYNHHTLRRECLGNTVSPLNESDTADIAALLSFLPLEKVIER